MSGFTASHCLFMLSLLIRQPTIAAPRPPITQLPWSLFPKPFIVGLYSLFLGKKRGHWPQSLAAPLKPCVRICPLVLQLSGARESCVLASPLCFPFLYCLVQRCVHVAMNARLISPSNFVMTCIPSCLHMQPRELKTVVFQRQLLKCNSQYRGYYQHWNSRS